MNDASDVNILKNYDNPGAPVPESVQKALVNVNAYQKPTEKELKAYEKIREVTVSFMRTVLENCPPCEDRWAALTMLREVRMKANSSIALKGMF